MDLKNKSVSPALGKILKSVAIAAGILLSLIVLASAIQYLRSLRTIGERPLREYVVATAGNYLGCNEADGSHKQIIDTYNAQDPLPRGYQLSYEDSWCAAFVSVVMMDAGLEDWVPTECSCQELIALMEKPGDWEESDWYIPQIGDFVFYAWDHRCIGDCHCWADHVGIVVGVYGPIIKVIEGNKDDAVAYRYIWVGHPEIRGYGLPYYHKMAACDVTPWDD